MRSERELTESYLRNYKTVWNICYPFFLSQADTEDAVQETFLRLTQTDKTFADDDHEKAWLITTARNVCKDEYKRARRKELPLERAGETAAAEPQPDETMQVLHSLPERYRTALYLFYYEGCKSAEIAKLLHRTDATVRSDLRRGRLLLKKRLEELQNEK